MSTPILAAAGFFLMAIVIGWMHLMVRSGALGRNRALGIRTAATLASDDAWARAHSAAAPWLLSTVLAAVISGLAGVGLTFFDPKGSDVIAVVVILGGFASIVALLIASAVVAHRAAKKAPATPPDGGMPGDVAR